VLGTVVVVALLRAPLLVAALVGLPVGLLGWQRWHRTAATVNRWGRRSRRKSGVASTLDLWRVGSWLALRRHAATVRPSITGLPWRDRLRLAGTEFAVPLVRVGPWRLWASIEDVVTVFGGPRTGKTGWAAGRVLDAPGAVLVTSTRTDLHELTAALRSARGPVHVFNAVGLAGLTSTITFDPLTGCADPVAATERATDLLTAASTNTGAGDREFWENQGRRVLAALLHAAALGGLGMRDVLAWVADPDTAKAEVTSLLRRSPEPSFVEDATQFLETNDRTRSSITSTIMPALGWLTSATARAAAAGGTPFDVEQLLQSRATVYLLGAEETHTAPLVAALTGYIARQARRIAATRPSGRLDPPLTLVLDEAALISPVPLESWTADMGGRGVTIIAAFQSRAQLIARWGPVGAAIILNNSGAVLLFGGTRDKADLEYFSTLAGDRDEPVAAYDQLGQLTSRTVRKVPVLSPAQLANLPARRVVAFRRGMPVTVGRAQMAWTRRDVRAAVRAARREGADVLRGAERVLRVHAVRVDTTTGADTAAADSTAADRSWADTAGREVRADAD
jgi:type IV secretory pathway TraG/TraD family ATPase VirD4